MHACKRYVGFATLSICSLTRGPESPAAAIQIGSLRRGRRQRRTRRQRRRGRAWPTRPGRRCRCAAAEPVPPSFSRALKNMRRSACTRRGTAHLDAIGRLRCDAGLPGTNGLDGHAGKAGAVGRTGPAGEYSLPYSQSLRFSTARRHSPLRTRSAAATVRTARSRGNHCSQLPVAALGHSCA